MDSPVLRISRWGRGVELSCGSASWNVELGEEVLGTAAQLAGVLHEQRWSQPHPAEERLQSLATALGDCFPPELRALLEGGEALALHTEDLDLPWESAAWEGRYLWQRRAVSRGEAGRPRVSGSLVTLLADPDGLTGWLVEEARSLADTLQPYKTESYQGGQVTRERLRAALAGRPTALLYLGALAETGTARRSPGRLFLADGPVSPDGLRDLLEDPWPPLVYLNLYSAGPPTGTRLLERFDSWARLLLEMGAQCVAGPMWDLPPALSARLGHLFCTSLARGETALAAAQTARQGLPEDAYLARHALGLWGDANFRLPELADAQDPTVRGELQAEYALEVLSGPEEGRQILLYSGPLKMGKAILIGSPGMRVNDVELRDPELDNRACSLELTTEGWLLTRTGGPDSALTLNGLPVLARACLSAGDVLGLGSSRLRLQRADAPGDGDAPEELGRFLLEVERGVAEDQGRLFLLERGVTVVGRNADCTLRLSDPAVSRHHLSIVFKDGYFQVTHVGSTRTIINGVPLEETRELQPDDLLQLSGKTFLRFSSARGQHAQP